MKHTAITQRLSGLGGAKWEIHRRGRELATQGKDIIELTIGEPDVSTPPELVEAACDAMRRGRTTYSSGRGEIGLRTVLAEHHSRKTGRQFGANQVLCFPGTQTALFAILLGAAEAGDDVLVGDPMYATYEGVIRATGATVVPVPLRPENGFRIRADDIAEKITPRTRAILLTTPHNPTGAILTAKDIEAIGKLAQENDFWIISDEVYEELVFDGEEHHSALKFGDLADRVIIASSISKSHAAPGFRSGWCIGPTEFVEALLPLSETMLFGNQPFIADMTEAAIRGGSTVAGGMRDRFRARAVTLEQRLHGESAIRVHRPQAGMFAVINVSATGMNGDDYALDLLNETGVAVMPGASFGETMTDWIRVALTVSDEQFATACDRIIAHAGKLRENVA
ncbi:MAG: pyridoxal phosphate-dependent aminotransferase [Hyphomicrobiales bacterium]|nr:pyridoxal phosphate-dependent aminotransferase [Hyphomicrobiales bacterium]MCP4997605.1 pyridoxal phosphate-dependent aminotransferase [Hyphomicrobiales bacterium]